jgi:hypothetical protein
MKNLFSVLLIALVFSFLSKDVLAQADGLPNRALDESGPHSKMDPWYSEQWSVRLPPTTGSLNGPPVREPRVLRRGILAPSPGDQAAFASFLRMPDTGLTRLLPSAAYDSKTSHPKNLASIRGGGAYYSFAALTHVYGYGSDIELSQHAFSVGFAGADYGMLTMLGNVPLEQLSENDSRAQFISSYQPPLPEHLARAEARRFRLRGGVTVDGLNYQSRLPVIENSTYLLRSISYDQSDVLVAFRVVRRDQDGSVVIAWKLLKMYQVPELAR